MLTRIQAATAFLIAVTLLSASLAPCLSAQGCTTGTFWQCDTLPASPSSIPTGVSVIQGMCEGERAGVVFEVPTNMSVQRITNTGSWTLAIPNQSNLLGQQFYQQAFVFDPPLNAFGGAMSDAAAWQIGN